MATAAQPIQRVRTGGPSIWTGRVLFGFCAVALLMTTYLWYDLGEPWEPGTSAVLAYLFFAVHMVLLGRRVIPMDPVVWVPIGLLLFHFGVPVAIEWIGLQTASGYDPWNATGSPAVLSRGYCAALTALVSFQWGVHLAGVRDLSRESPDEVRDNSLGVPAVLFTIGALMMTAVGIAIVGPSNVFGRYGDWWDAKLLGADARFIDIGLVFAGAGAFALLASDEKNARWRRWLGYLVFAFCVGIALQKGDRTSMTTIAVGAGWCYSRRVRKIGWTPVLVAAFVGLLAFPVIREWRAERSLEESKRATVRELLGSSIYNLGGSVNAIVYTIEVVPSRKGYAWGETFLSAALNAIPNVGLTKGKTWLKQELEDSPSVWLTWQIAPEWAATGGGYGFAMAAEWYYNFGLLGMLLGMALTGWGVAKARNSSSHSSLALVWSATLFAGVSIWIRNVVGYALKVAVWPIIGLWLIHRLVILLRGKRVKRRAASSAPAEASFTR